MALLQIVGALFVQRTQGHPHVVFHRDVLWEHFGQLNFLFDNKAIRTAVIGKTYFWLVSNALMLVLVDLSKQLHPGDAPAAAKALSLMPAVLGVGIMAGSLLASLLSRKRINLHIVPLAGIAMTVGLVLAGCCPAHDTPLLCALVLTGAAGGCYMVPLYAYVQDRAVPHQRARVLAGVNLLDSICGLAAAGVVWVLATCRINAQNQLLAFSVPTLVAALYTMKLWPKSK
jgi:acyl-[acyl-carrier-protein]-phospholipid O-acyltransferase/long-chain-fatty-acid--[acyl-carrier-protein] ligase